MKKIFKIEIIENYLKANQMTEKEFCRLCNIPLSTLQKLFAHNFDFDLVDIFKVSRVLNLHIKDLFIKN